MFILDEKHLDEAKQIAKAHRKKKSCDNCYDRGWIGVSEQNLLVLCTRCVDMDKAVDAWKEYVSQHEELKEHFSELFEEKPADTAENQTKSHTHEHQKLSPNAKQTFTPGNRRTGHQKKIG